MKIQKKQPIVLGIDIGGTNSAFGLVDKNGEILYQDSVPTNSYKPAEEPAAKIVAKIKTWLNEKENSFVVTAIGVGDPNENYYSGSIENPTNLGWKQVHLPGLFAAHFEVPVFVTNDANAAAALAWHELETN